MTARLTYFAIGISAALVASISDLRVLAAVLVIGSTAFLWFEYWRSKRVR